MSLHRKQNYYWNMVQKSKQEDENNRTSLHAAAFNNSTEAAKLLLEHRAEMKQEMEQNRTPLHLAALNKSTEAAKLLLEHGAEIEDNKMYTIKHGAEIGIQCLLVGA